MATAETISIIPKKIKCIPNKARPDGRYDLIIRQVQEMYAAGDHVGACDGIIKILEHVANENRAPNPITAAEIQRPSTWPCLFSLNLTFGYLNHVLNRF